MKDLYQLTSQYLYPVLLFLLGQIVQLLVNLVAGMLGWGKTPTQFLQLIAFITGVSLGLAALTLLFRRLPRRPPPVPVEMQAQPRSGLVALVGPGRAAPAPAALRENVAEAALKYHLEKGRLQRAWLVTSDQGIDTARDIEQKYGEALVKIRLVHNFYDLNETYEAVRQIYREAAAEGLDPGDVIADYTGGTKPMSVGMALAAVSGSYPMEWTSGKPYTEAAPIQTELRPAAEEPPAARAEG